MVFVVAALLTKTANPRSIVTESRRTNDQIGFRAGITANELQMGFSLTFNVTPTIIQVE